ncbi:MAG: hypothetical protein JO332_00085 [Planctomycetaceae bacterium]|nr:hypothetical protein [Planctomycetaceae bacterium]
MKMLFIAALPWIALLIPGPLQGSARKAAGEIRVYVLDKDHRAASLNGLTVVLVTEDTTGAEKLIPMTVMATSESGTRAPHCALRSRAVEGTALTMALCSLAGDGRLSKDEGGGPRTVDAPAGPEEDPNAAERTVVDFDVPYFKARMPADHLCGPGCRASVRVTLGGTSHSTRSFPCPARSRAGSPTCCLHHHLIGECAELTRHLAADDRPAAEAALERLSRTLQRNISDGSNDEACRDCLVLVDWIRKALSDGESERAAGGVEELKKACATRFASCAGPGD